MIDKLTDYRLKLSSIENYDIETLTALELIGRTAGKTNECVEAVNTFDDRVDNLEGTGLTTAVALKIEQMKLNGDFSGIINQQLFNDMNTDLQTKINARSKKLYIDVTEYGLVGDGVVDNLAALQTLVNSLTTGGVLFFPKGVYKFSGNISIANLKDITFLGQDATIDTTGQYAGFCKIETTSENIIFEGLTFKGKNAALAGQYNRTIDIWGNYCKVVKCRFKGNYGAGVFIAGYGNIVNNCFFDDVNNGGLGDYGCVEIVGNKNIVENNIIINYDFSGVSIMFGYGNVIHGNIILGKTSYSPNTMGIYVLNGGSHNVISDNYIEFNANEGIVIIQGDDKRMTGNKVTGNTVKNNKYIGISLQSNGNLVVDTIVSNNRVTNDNYNASADGIVVNTSSYATVEGNHVQNCKHGIYVMNVCGHNIFTGNIVRECEVGITFSGYYSLCQHNIIESVVPNSVGISADWVNTGMMDSNVVQGITKYSVGVNNTNLTVGTNM